MTQPPAPCPVCHAPRKPRAENPAFPFCSRRCRQVDLGKWLGEEYRIPQGTAEEVEDEAPRDAPSREREYDA